MTNPAMPNPNSTAPGDDLPARSSSSWRSKIWWVVIGLPLVVLATGGWFWFASANELQSRLNALKARGLPTSASEVNDFYKVPAGVNDRTQEWVAAIQAVEAADLYTIGKDLPIVGDNPKEIPPPGQPWEDFEASRTLVRSLDKELQLIRLAASVPGQVRFPHDFSNGINTIPPETQNAPQLRRLLQLDAHVSAHEGNFTRTKQDIKDMFTLSNAMSGEPCLMSQLVRFGLFTIAVSSLEQHSPYCGWTDSELLSLQETILSAQFETGMQRAMAGETAMILTEFDKLPLGPFRQTNKLALLTLMDEASASYSHPWPESLRIQAKSDANLQLLTSQSFNRFMYRWCLLFAPSIEQLGQSTCRAVARQRITNLGIAAYRHQLKHGQLPTSLADLDTSLIAGPTAAGEYAIDPFDGQPLRFRKDATGLLIYSVSQNLIDDGGDVVSSESNPRPGDLGFLILTPMPAIK